ncbi:hypothetical protein Trydic_g7612 [Trypoxylus dichotomus]
MQRIDYRFSRTAWMTSAIYSDWFKHSFIMQESNYLKLRHFPKKASLLVDNFTGHLREEVARKNGQFTMVNSVLFNWGQGGESSLPTKEPDEEENAEEEVVTNNNTVKQETAIRAFDTCLY